jgi:hypothetical protein
MEGRDGWQLHILVKLVPGERFSDVDADGVLVGV